MENNQQPLQEQNNSRRKFLQNGLTALAGFYIVPRHVLGGPGFIAPIDKLNLAAVGIGGKGASDITNAWNNASPINFLRQKNITIIEKCLRR
jgi:hypothetical protein